MKSFFALFCFVLLFPAMLPAQSPVVFDDYFLDKTLRIDYFHIGDASEEIVSIDRVYRQGIWAGNPGRLLDPFNNGHYFIKVYDIAGNRLIYSKGFSSYFGEYKTTAPAKEGIVRTYHETALIPCPKRPVRFVLEVRGRDNVYHPFYIDVIDPDSMDIQDELPHRDDKVFTLLRSGNPHQKVDLAFIGEGYTREEEEKFQADAERFKDYLFSIEPYRSLKDRFNIYGVLRPSSESGTDEPRKGRFKNTALNASFNAFHLERYLLTEDNKSLHDIASNVPCDVLCILVNSGRYGGGGIYNFYAIFTADTKPWAPNVFLHEFGHAFAGLADEYYAADVAYDEFYPKGVEPTEPNITSLLDPSNPKWKAFITPNTDLPTDWNQEEYDRLGKTYNQLRKEQSAEGNRLIREGAAREEIDRVKGEYARRIDAINETISRFFEKSPVKDTVGLFEGAGYSSTGLYRPMLNCLMFKFVKDEMRYCKVCEKAVAERIRFYSE